MAVLMGWIGELEFIRKAVPAVCSTDPAMQQQERFSEILKFVNPVYHIEPSCAILTLFEATHRVCAKIGLPDSSFWRFTGQTSWCNTIGYYGGEFGHLPRCPSETPTWCICKWALARWIEGEGCDNIDIECGATDICNLKASYKDYNVELSDAHKCVEQKCPTEWNAC